MHSGSMRECVCLRTPNTQPRRHPLPLPLQAACTSLNWLANLAVGLTFPLMLHSLGIAGSYLMFGAANAGAAVFASRAMVETKQRSLAQIRALLVGSSGSLARAGDP